MSAGSELSVATEVRRTRLRQLVGRRATEHGIEPAGAHAFGRSRAQVARAGLRRSLLFARLVPGFRDSVLRRVEYAGPRIRREPAVELRAPDAIRSSAARVAGLRRFEISSACVPDRNAEIGIADAADERDHLILDEAGTAIEEHVEVGVRERPAVMREREAVGVAERLVVVVRKLDVVPHRHGRIVEVAEADLIQVQEAHDLAGLIQHCLDLQEARDQLRLDSQRRHEGTAGGHPFRDVDGRLDRNIERILLLVVRVERRHANVGDVRHVSAEPLRDFTVDHGAAVVTDQLQRRAEQAVGTELVIETDQAGEDAVRRRFREDRSRQCRTPGPSSRRAPATCRSHRPASCRRHR